MHMWMKDKQHDPSLPADKRQEHQTWGWSYILLLHRAYSDCEIRGLNSGKKSRWENEGFPKRGNSLVKRKMHNLQILEIRFLVEINVVGTQDLAQ